MMKLSFENHKCQKPMMKLGFENRKCQKPMMNLSFENRKCQNPMIKWSFDGLQNPSGVCRPISGGPRPSKPNFIIGVLHFLFSKLNLIASVWHFSIFETHFLNGFLALVVLKTEFHHGLLAFSIFKTPCVFLIFYDFKNWVEAGVHGEIHRPCCAIVPRHMSHVV